MRTTPRRVTNTTNGQHLGDTLRDLRMAAGLTQLELSKLSHVGQMTISQMERSEYIPRLDALERLFVTLGKRVVIIIVDADTPEPPPE